VVWSGDQLLAPDWFKNINWFTNLEKNDKNMTKTTDQSCRTPIKIGVLKSGNLDARLPFSPPLITVCIGLSSNMRIL
jgi:hypothetical protein